MPIIHEMSTRGIDRAARLAFWQAGSSQIGGMHHHVHDQAGFNGSARLATLSKLKLGIIQVSPEKASWTRDLMKRTDDHFFRLVFQCKGTAHIEQGDNRFSLQPGEWTVLNGKTPHTVRSDEPMEELLAIVPASMVAPRVFDATRQLAGPHSTGKGVGLVMFNFAKSVVRGESTPQSAVDDHLESASIELIWALIEETLGSRTPISFRETRVERIEAYISRHLSDPDLSIQRIAEAMGCSKRYIHSLFAGGPSVQSIIWSMRLDNCSRDLKRSARNNENITTIALSHGFSGSAHFSRMFKAHFGVSPREFRQKALHD